MFAEFYFNAKEIDNPNTSEINQALFRVGATSDDIAERKFKGEI